MKYYLFTALLLSLIYSGQAQNPLDTIWRGSPYDRIGILQNQVAFLMRDCLDTHRRLDSLIGEMGNVPHFQLRAPDSSVYRPLTLTGTEVDGMWLAGRNKTPLLSWGDNALGRKMDTVLVIRTISNELKSTIWRPVDHALYQVRCYAVYDPNGTEDPVFLDEHKKPFPDYIKIW